MQAVRSRAPPRGAGAGAEGRCRPSLGPPVPTVVSPRLCPSPGVPRGQLPTLPEGASSWGSPGL